MIKRPLDSRFKTAVLEDRKITTIRDKPWPIGKPIMLYNWSGLPYRSKHSNVAAVVVKRFWTIRITHLEGGQMSYDLGMYNGLKIYETEGFASKKEMDNWFRPLVRVGQTITKTLMRFERTT